MNPTPALRATGGMLQMASGQGGANPQTGMGSGKNANPQMNMTMGMPANPMAQKGTLIKKGLLRRKKAQSQAYKVYNGSTAEETARMIMADSNRAAAGKPVSGVRVMKSEDQSDDLAETRRGRKIPAKGKKVLIKKVRQFDPEKRRKRRQAAYTPALGTASTGLAVGAAMPSKAKTKWETEYNAARDRHEKAAWDYEHHTIMHEMADPKARGGHAKARYEALKNMKSAQEDMHRLHTARASRLASASRNRRALAIGAAVTGAAAVTNEIQRRRSGRKSHKGWWNGS